MNDNNMCYLTPITLHKHHHKLTPVLKTCGKARQNKKRLCHFPRPFPLVIHTHLHAHLPLLLFDLPAAVCC